MLDCADGVAAGAGAVVGMGASVGVGVDVGVGLGLGEGVRLGVAVGVGCLFNFTEQSVVPVIVHHGRGTKKTFLVARMVTLADFKPSRLVALLTLSISLTPGETASCE